MWIIRDEKGVEYGYFLSAKEARDYAKEVEIEGYEIEEV